MNEDSFPLRDYVDDILKKVRNFYYQYDLNGCQNIWIAKPSDMSRGRDIKVFNNFHKLIRYMGLPPAFSQGNNCATSGFNSLDKNSGNNGSPVSKLKNR
jgi:hypothetical protein